MLETKYIVPGYITISKEDDYFFLCNQYTSAKVKLQNQYFQEYADIYNHGINSLDTELSNFLYNNRFFLPKEEVTNVINSYYAANDSRLYITIMPTEACNFRCIYCYENHTVNEEKKLNYDAILDFINKQLNLHSFQSIAIMWFGGEPMLRMNEITTFMQKLKQSLETKQIQLLSNITTNGYFLTEENFTRLIDASVNEFQITLDGDKHDSFRVLADNSPTLSIIMQNIERMHQTDKNFHAIIRVNIDKTSGNNDAFYKKLSDVIGSDERFTISIHNIFSDPEIKNDNIDYCKSSELLEKNKKVAKDNGLTINEDTNHSPIDTCYANCKNSFVFRPNGSIVKCTVSLNEEWNQIGEYSKEAYQFDSNTNDKLVRHVQKDTCNYCTNIIDCEKTTCLKQLFIDKTCNYSRKEIAYDII